MSNYQDLIDKIVPPGDRSCGCDYFPFGHIKSECEQEIELDPLIWAQRVQEWERE